MAVERQRIEQLARDAAREALAVSRGADLSGAAAGDEPGNIAAMEELCGGRPLAQQWAWFVEAYNAVFEALS